MRAHNISRGGWARAASGRGGRGGRSIRGEPLAPAWEGAAGEFILHAAGPEPLTLVCRRVRGQFAFKEAAAREGASRFSTAFGCSALTQMGSAVCNLPQVHCKSLSFDSNTGNHGAFPPCTLFENRSQSGARAWQSICTSALTSRVAPAREQQTMLDSET